MHTVHFLAEGVECVGLAGEQFHPGFHRTRQRLEVAQAAFEGPHSTFGKGHLITPLLDVRKRLFQFGDLMFGRGKLARHFALPPLHG